METVSIQTATDDPSPEPSNLQQWCQKTLALCDRTGELTIRIVNRDEMAVLNQEYRKKTGPTNVLSFPANIPKDVPVNCLGDIIICATVVNREAEAQAKDNAAHWAHMVVHGTLHLLGYDHQTDVEAEVMESKEKQILAEMGFANPYADEQEVNNDV